MKIKLNFYPQTEAVSAESGSARPQGADGDMLRRVKIRVFTLRLQMPLLEKKKIHVVA